MINGNGGLKMVRTFLRYLKTMIKFDQTRLIHLSGWNYLIILDACRFDFFRELWPYPGSLVMARSPASETRSWLSRTFPYRYRYRIFSSNPFINSRGLGHWKYQARDHFQEVIDLWRDRWNDRYGTVLPGAVYHAVKDSPPRAIIWFMQPHAPYLLRPLKERLSPEEFIAWRPGDDMYPPPEDLRLMYRESLREVLNWVRRLIEKLAPPILISSDHGELLGEYGKVGHPIDMDVPELRKVPMVVIE